MAKATAKNEKGRSAKKRKTAKKKAAAEEQAAEQTEQESATATVEQKTQKDKKAEEESIHAKYERIKKGDLYLTDLQKLTVPELHEIAKNEDIKEHTGLAKQNLVFRILKERIRQNGLLYGEGVLEVLPDGYGFLRNPS
ncbi:MAG: Rho termination factor N-terminal domain-containing protein, partial [Planctomycetota bacterium]